VSSLLDMLAIAMRGDVRSDVLKELERTWRKLNEYQNHPGIDAARLRALMSNLMRLRSDLSSAAPAWLQPLRDSEFLAAIKHRSAIPGGTCEFDLPDYYLLAQPARRGAHGAFAALAGAAAPAVRCDRRTAVAHAPERPLARGGRQAAAVFNVAFDRETPYQLLRICCRRACGCIRRSAAATIAAACASSSGPASTAAPKQTESDVPFVLTCCP
jgi:cell division protein ZapD